jgi:hypothetical protein
MSVTDQEYGASVDLQQLYPFFSAVHSQIDSGGPHGITSWLFAVCRKVK